MRSGLTSPKHAPNVLLMTQHVIGYLPLWGAILGALVSVIFVALVVALIPVLRKA